MKLFFLTIAAIFGIVSCNKAQNPENDFPEKSHLVYGGDFSIMKKLEDLGGEYKLNGEVKEGFQIFRENGYTWCRLRIFHTPNMEGVTILTISSHAALSPFRHRSTRVLRYCAFLPAIFAIVSR